jgi:hypothetical protein
MAKGRRKYIRPLHLPTSAYTLKNLINPPIFVGMEKDSKDSVMVYTRIDLSELDKKAYSTLHTNVKKEELFVPCSRSVK